MAKTDTGVVNIHGREYKTVALRVSEFRADRSDWALTTEIIVADEERVVMRAAVAGPDGRVVATGHAEEVRASSQINRTSALENAETSAIGRALAAAGYGGSEFASADEVANAIAQQQSEAPPARAKPQVSKVPFGKREAPPTSASGDLDEQAAWGASKKADKGDTTITESQQRSLFQAAGFRAQALGIVAPDAAHTIVKQIIQARGIESTKQILKRDIVSILKEIQAYDIP